MNYSLQYPLHICRPSHMALILKWALIYYIALTCFSLHEDIGNEQVIGPNHETADLSVDLKLLPPGAGPCHAAPVPACEFFLKTPPATSLPTGAGPCPADPFPVCKLLLKTPSTTG